MPTASISLGVEEEYQIIDPATRQLRSRAGRVLPLARQALGDEVTNELYLSQIEVGTPVCQTLGEARAELKRLRKAVIAAAGRDGNQIAAAGTHPFSHWEDQSLTPKPRYSDILEVYQQHAREQVIFGCHVHTGVNDRELAIQVMNRACRWLPPVLALAANSPFWLGNDTGFASYRAELFGRFPMTGLPIAMTDRAEYDAVVADLVATEIIEDASKIYWDIRPSTHFETLEFRIADVAQSVDEAILTAGLCRGIALTCLTAAERGEPLKPDRPELLRAAKWLAARHGLDGNLFDFEAKRAVPAALVVEKLLNFVRPALEELGEWDEVHSLANDVLQRGNGAQRQRAVYERSNRFEDVIDAIIAETSRDLG